MVSRDRTRILSMHESVQRKLLPLPIVRAPSLDFCRLWKWCTVLRVASCVVRGTRRNCLDPSPAPSDGRSAFIFTETLQLMFARLPNGSSVMLRPSCETPEGPLTPHTSALERVWQTDHMTRALFIYLFTAPALLQSISFCLSIHPSVFLSLSLARFRLSGISYFASSGGCDDAKRCRSVHWTARGTTLGRAQLSALMQRDLLACDPKAASPVDVRPCRALNAPMTGSSDDSTAFIFVHNTRWPVLPWSAHVEAIRDGERFSVYLEPSAFIIAANLGGGMPTGTAIGHKEGLKFSCHRSTGRCSCP
ncbi:unnamed protein product [Protopolystoma xenopodis]|uniref:Uncharacterized protein n=1 Tax=Protopolystoma xenopodis TaxID=117903 RepID=A0A3S4ZK34_9PLAT|nr:unnamed protein product [Protopolystoma xenopodis]